MLGSMLTKVCGSCYLVSLCTRPTILDLQKTSFPTDVPGDRAEGPGLSNNCNSLMISGLLDGHGCTAEISYG